MHKQLIEALLAKGWQYALIASKANIAEHKLRTGILCVREQRRLEEMAYTWAGIQVDDLPESD